MLPEWYNRYKDFIELSIENKIQKYFSQKWDSKVHTEFIDILRYALAWWKKIRAILALETYLSFSRKKLENISQEDDICNFLVALECIHAYSLIHDDLPAMDNDELRRWIPTVWKKFWEYNGILAWDLLNTFTFELLSDIKNPILSQKLVKLIATSVWHYGMIGWQVEDLYFESHSYELALDILKNIHNKKTWALIKASILWWAILSEKEVNIDILTSFWLWVWLAFQIQDDLLDVLGTVEETGKSIWWEKKGFVHFLWVEKTKKYLNILIKDLQEKAQIFSSEKIDFLVEYVGKRKK